MQEIGIYRPASREYTSHRRRSYRHVPYRCGWSMYLMSMHLVDMYLIGVYLTGMYVIGTYRPASH